MDTDLLVTREVRRSIAQFSDTATPAQAILLRMSTIAAAGSVQDNKLKSFILQLVKGIKVKE